MSVNVDLNACLENLDRYCKEKGKDPNLARLIALRLHRELYFMTVRLVRDIEEVIDPREIRKRANAMLLMKDVHPEKEEVAK